VQPAFETADPLERIIDADCRGLEQRLKPTGPRLGRLANEQAFEPAAARKDIGTLHKTLFVGGRRRPFEALKERPDPADLPS